MSECSFIFKKMYKTTIHQQFSSVLKVGGQHGSSASLVIAAVLGKRRVWREIQNLHMYVHTRFVIIKVRNWIPACTVKTPLRYSALAWDELNFAEEP